MAGCYASAFLPPTPPRGGFLNCSVSISEWESLLLDATVGSVKECSEMLWLGEKPLYLSISVGDCYL